MGDEKERFGALREGKWFDFCGNGSPRCPHCGESFSISQNEAWFLYDDNDRHEVDCPACEETFKVKSWASWTFSTDEQEGLR